MAGRYYCFTCSQYHSRRPTVVDRDYKRFYDSRDDYSTKYYTSDRYRYESPMDRLERWPSTSRYSPPSRYREIDIERHYEGTYAYDQPRVDRRISPAISSSSSEESIPRTPPERRMTHPTPKVTPKATAHVVPQPPETGVPRLSLADQLAKQGLERIRVEPDGNCLFRALAVQLGRVSHLELRETVCDFIESNQPDFAHLIEGDFNDYLWRLRQEGTWGDVETVVAITKMYPVSIVIYQGGQDPHHFRHSGDELRRELRLAYVGNCHYDVVMPPTSNLY